MAKKTAASVKTRRQTRQKRVEKVEKKQHQDDTETDHDSLVHFESLSSMENSQEPLELKDYNNIDLLVRKSLFE